MTIFSTIPHLEIIFITAWFALLNRVYTGVKLYTSYDHSKGNV